MLAAWMRLVVVWAAAVCAVDAGAGVVSGRFEGIAFGSRINAMSPTPGNFDGETVTGSFRFDTAGLLPPEVGEPEPPDFRMRFVTKGALQLVFHAAGRTAVFGVEPETGDAVVAENLAGQQAVELLADFTFFYHFASLRLAGPLLDGVDLATFHAGPVALSDSYAHFFDSRDFGGSVELTQLSFDARAVPEPRTVLLAAAALAAWAGLRLRNCRRRRNPC